MGLWSSYLHQVVKRHTAHPGSVRLQEALSSDIQPQKVSGHYASKGSHLAYAWTAEVPMLRRHRVESLPSRQLVWEGTSYYHTGSAAVLWGWTFPSLTVRSWVDPQPGNLLHQACGFLFGVDKETWMVCHHSSMPHTQRSHTDVQCVTQGGPVYIILHMIRASLDGECPSLMATWLILVLSYLYRITDNA